VHDPDDVMERVGQTWILAETGMWGTWSRAHNPAPTGDQRPLIGQGSEDAHVESLAQCEKSVRERRIHSPEENNAMHCAFAAVSVKPLVTSCGPMLQ
jgi:hypothetical protein